MKTFVFYFFCPRKVYKKDRASYCTSCLCPLKPKLDLENLSLVMNGDTAKGGEKKNKNK